MSNATQDLGWWIASDGRWYPPELHPDALGETVAPRVELHLVSPRDESAELALADEPGDALSPVTDEPPGPGWWVATDGHWYPPELHPDAEFLDESSWGDDEEGYEDVGVLAEYTSYVLGDELADVIPIASAECLPASVAAVAVVDRPVFRVLSDTTPAPVVSTPEASPEPDDSFFYASDPIAHESVRGETARDETETAVISETTWADFYRGDDEQDDVENLCGGPFGVEQLLLPPPLEVGLVSGFKRFMQSGNSRGQSWGDIPQGPVQRKTLRRRT